MDTMKLAPKAKKFLIKSGKTKMFWSNSEHQGRIQAREENAANLEE